MAYKIYVYSSLVFKCRNSYKMSQQVKVLAVHV